MNMVLYIAALCVTITIIYFIFKTRNIKMLHDVTSRFVLCRRPFHGERRGVLKNDTLSRLTFIYLDVSDSRSIHQALDKVHKLLGPHKGLWGLVNNAGIMTSFSPPETVTAEVMKKFIGEPRMSRRPEVVTETMEHALFAEYPKLNYYVGIDANFFFRPLEFPPNIVADYVLGRPSPYGDLIEELKK